MVSRRSRRAGRRPPVVGVGSRAGSPCRRGSPARRAQAYERLIHDAMSGDHTLFTTSEGIERLWELSVPLLEAPPPVRVYPPGSWGPNAIHQLIAPHAWRLPFERAWRTAPT